MTASPKTALPAEPQKIEYELISHLEGINIHAFLVTIHRRKTHYHSDVELFIPLEGAVSIQVGRKRYDVRQDEFSSSMPMSPTASLLPAA